MAAILTALVERPHTHPVFAKPFDPPLVPFQFSIIVAGFYPLDPRCLQLFEGQEKLNTPSLHVLGRGDTIVGEERSLPLTNVFNEARVEWHDGGAFMTRASAVVLYADINGTGHHTPSKSSWRSFFKSYINSFILPRTLAGDRIEVASPSGSDGSAPPSGASTPTVGRL